jgi:hypothetical protein
MGGLRYEHAVIFGWLDNVLCDKPQAPADTELTGPMALRLFLEVAGTDDADLFAMVEKWRGNRFVPFEGSYGFGRDRITTAGTEHRSVSSILLGRNRSSPCRNSKLGSR